MFAETQNTDVLMDKCVKFITANKGQTLAGDWMKKVEKSQNWPPESSKSSKITN